MRCAVKHNNAQGLQGCWDGCTKPANGPQTAHHVYTHQPLKILQTLNHACKRHTIQAVHHSYRRETSPHAGNLRVTTQLDNLEPKCPPSIPYRNTACPSLHTCSLAQKGPAGPELWLGLFELCRVHKHHEQVAAQTYHRPPHHFTANQGDSNMPA